MQRSSLETKVAMDASSVSPSIVSVPTSRLLPIRTPRSAPAEWTTTDDSSAATVEEEEPVTPTARLMEGIYIVVTIGLGSPVNLQVFSAGAAAELARFPRFRSIQVTDGNGNNPRWARTAVNVEDHMIVPTIDTAAVAADPDRAVEDYVASVYTLPMDRSRPLWEFHFLDFPTSEAASTVVLRVHHSLGDGMSLITLLLASSRSAADPTRLPAMPEQPARTGAIYAPRRREPSSAGALAAFITWIWPYLVLAWNTMVDVSFFAATIAFLRDPCTPFRRADGDVTLNPRRRFVHRSLSLDDVKFVKNAMSCTVNDVLVGATSAALSRYYFRKSGGTDTYRTWLRSVLLVNTRPTASLQTYANMIESGRSNDVAWGNQLGYILLPFHLAMHDNPLAYVRKAKMTVDRKKSSLEAIFTCKTSEVFVKMFGLKQAGAFIFRRMFANTTISFSNLVGPTEKIELCGHPVVFIAPSVYGVPQALIMHYQSYNNTIKIVLSVDEEIFPDYSQLLDDFVVSFGLIKDAASRLSESIKKE
ncbi:wax ester synthase/diacylglycerol acyltransferase 11-like isoform X1 [Triticum urartu]|uniref:wax ester synthase/diacylglycerol acyltransferase 11-like isoform X1 n=1 Tax=Triticum urartu TaxID=4572 RepID=UPI002044A4D4|nr:wax ester synthase/diacylglycerol acyltransferase 11-like isoform X1 [Triticum urartu]